MGNGQWFIVGDQDGSGKVVRRLLQLSRQRGWWAGPEDVCGSGGRLARSRYLSKADLGGLADPLDILRFLVCGGSMRLPLNQAQQDSDQSHLASIQCSAHLVRGACPLCARARPSLASQLGSQSPALGTIAMYHTPQQCDLKQVSSTLRTSASLSVKWGLRNQPCYLLGAHENQVKCRLDASFEDSEGRRSCVG